MDTAAHQVSISVHSRCPVRYTAAIRPGEQTSDPRHREDNDALSRLDRGVRVIGGAVDLGNATAADAKYPNWKGLWSPVVASGAGRQSFDPTKPEGAAQQAPLTAEYQKVFADSVAAQANGAIGNDPTKECYAAGMPRMMTYEAQEYVITPNVTYIVLGGDDNLRRISPMAAIGPRRSSRPIKGTRSASGWTRMATVPMTCSKPRPAAHSRGRVPMTAPDCRSIRQ